MATIEIVSKDVENLDGLAQHLYYLYTDDFGNQRVLRGGPEGNNTAGLLIGDIEVLDQDYATSFDFPQPGEARISQTIWTGTDAELFARIESAHEAIDYINSEGFDYNLPLIETILPSWSDLNDQNSNTVANFLGNSLGLSAEVEQFVQDYSLNVPGFNTTFEHSSFEKNVDSLLQAIDNASNNVTGFFNELSDSFGQAASDVIGGASELFSELFNIETSGFTSTNPTVDNSLLNFETYFSESLLDDSGFDNDNSWQNGNVFGNGTYSAFLDPNVLNTDGFFNVYAANDCFEKVELRLVG